MNPETKDSLSRAIFWMCFASLNFACMATLIHILSEHLSGIEVGVVRSALGSVVLVGFLWSRGLPIIGTEYKHLLSRGVIGSISNTFYFYALSGGKIAESTALIRTMSLMIPFVALWSLSERIRLRHYLCAVGGFSGTLFIVKPGLIEFSSFSGSALLCAITGAFAWASIRAIAQIEHPGTITLYLYFFSTFSGLFTMIAIGEPFVMLDCEQWFYMACLIAVGLAAQFGLVIAYKYAPVAVISPVNYLEIVFAAIFGWLVFRQAIDLTSAMGILVIIISATLIQDPVAAFRNWQRKSMNYMDGRL